MKQRTSLFLTITILALLLAGCGQAGPGAATTAVAPTVAAGSTTAVPEATSATESGGRATIGPEATSATTTDGQTTDALGMVEIKSGDPIVIGYALTIAGPNAALGLDSERGIELTIEDTGCTPEGGQSAATKLAANTKIVAIVGTTCSSEARVLAPVIDQAG